MQSKHLRSERPRSPRLPLDERLADEARFIKRWLDNPKATGAVSPSGRFLARAMAAYVDSVADGPIIELGPGTGPVTEALLDRGIPQEFLTMILEVRYGLSDFQGKLVGLEFFTGNSSHENLRLETLF